MSRNRSSPDFVDFCWSVFFCERVLRPASIKPSSELALTPICVHRSTFSFQKVTQPYRSAIRPLWARSSHWFPHSFHVELPSLALLLVNQGSLSVILVVFCRLSVPSALLIHHSRPTAGSPLISSFPGSLA